MDKTEKRYFWRAVAGVAASLATRMIVKKIQRRSGREAKQRPANPRD